MTDMQLTRRRSIALGATALTAGAAGLTIASEPAAAEAEVTLGSLDAADATLRPEDGQVYAPWLIAHGDWSYRVDVDPAEWQVYLLVGRNGNTSAIGMASGEATAREATGTFGVRGPITAADAWAPGDFAVGSGGQPTTQSVAVQLVFTLRDAAQESLVQAVVQDTATVTVKPGGTVAEVGASASIVMQDDEGDATPAPPAGGG